MTQTIKRADLFGPTFAVNSTIPGVQQLPTAAALTSGRSVRHGQPGDLGRNQ
jgi:hypothetical protein